MMRFVEIIKEQIQQLDIPELRIWLLNHLKEDATNLTEFFCQQVHHSEHKSQYTSPAVQFPAHLSILSLAYTYIPLQLREDLAEKLQKHMPFPDTGNVQNMIGLSEQFNGQLTDYQAAWSIIDALQKQGANHLIKILDNADETALKAFARLTKGSDLNILIETFLVNNTRDLEAVNRTKLIQFLRQPDFSGNMTRCLDALVAQASIALSIKLLLLISAPCSKDLEQLTDLRTHIAAYACPVDLEVIWAVCNLYQQVLQQEQCSDESDAFILLLHDLLQGMNVTRQIEFIKKLNQESIQLIIEYCLKRSVGNVGKQPVFGNLLRLLCSESLLSDNHLKMVKHQLLRQDLYLFDSIALYELAKEVLAEAKNNSGQCFGGDWIRQLLVSPRFIAASTPETLDHLSERYRLLCFTLNPLEHINLVTAFKEQDFYADEIEEQMRYLIQKELNHSEIKAELRVKQNKLLKFSIESSLNAMLYQLEEQCALQKGQDPETVKKALAVLYQYYRMIYPDLRMDLLGYWLKLYSPEFDVENKLYRKKGVYLFDSVGQKIGFLSESNQAMTFVDEEPVLLIHTGSVQINEPVYDQEGAVVGFFTESGQIRCVDGPVQNVSARIISMLSEKDLQQPALGLELLIQNVLSENSIAILYSEDDASVGSPKRQWLDRRLVETIRDTQKLITTPTLRTFLNTASNESIFVLLGTIKHKENAVSLFHEILNQEKIRTLLFSGFYASDFQHFLERHGSASCFAEYLIHYHDKPWFAEGLSHFAYYSKKYKTQHLLSEALALLFDEQNPERMAICDAVLERLIESEACAAIVLKEFLNDRNQLTLQQTNNPIADQQISHSEINRVARYFHKKHVMRTIQNLNVTPYWQEKSQYRLFLHILNKQHDGLFPTRNYGVTAKQDWQANELNDLTRFINRHLSKKRPFDSHFAIGHRILGELVFRSAHLGQISLFYAKKKFNSSLARLSFSRPFLERLVTKFWIPEGIKEQIADEVSRIRALFQDQALLKNEFKEDQVFQDWRHLVHQTWREINKKKLPMICAYLLNYSGQKKPLLRLLHDYFNSFQNTMDYIYPVTKLLREFPGRDVSAVIFDALELFLIKNPCCLDATVLGDMAYYFAKKTNQDTKSPQAELNLLIYLGQSRHYALVQKGCEELAQTCDNKELKQRLIKGAVEAEIEGSLSSSLGRFYFGFLKMIKRLWYYGFNAEENRSRIVKFCDDNSPDPQRNRASEEIKIPAKSTQENSSYVGFAVKRKQLISLLNTVKRSTITKSLTTLPVHGKQTLFGNSDVALPLREQNVVRRQDPVVQSDELSTAI